MFSQLIETTSDGLETLIRGNLEESSSTTQG